MEPALVSPKGVVPQHPQELQPCWWTDASNLDRSPSSGTAICQPRRASQVDMPRSSNVAPAQSEEVLAASALPTSEVTHVSGSIDVVDGGNMISSYGRFMDSAGNEGKHGHKTRGEAMDPANPVLSIR